MNWDEAIEPGLIERAKNGDEKAFARLVDQNFDLVQAVCRDKCKDPYLAEEAILNTFSLAWQKLDKYRGDAKFSSWLYAIAKNASNTLLRKQKDEPSLDDENLGLSNKLHENSRSLESRVEREVVNRDLLERIRDLSSDEEWEALVKQVIGGYSVAEIARDLGKTVGATKTMLSRMKAKLRSTIPPELFF